MMENNNEHKKLQKPEILAPAGSMEALYAAVGAGADAVYLGGSQFGARAYADNFEQEDLIKAIEYCHLYGVKVYLTVNTLFRNEELAGLVNYLKPYYQAGLDAVIVQDFGVMARIHACFPGLAIHASTQMTITTEYAYTLLQQYGVTRIVPARELSLEEIAGLKKERIDFPEKESDEYPVPELEVFVQGALCYCYSGQCLFSSMLGGRSGNRGRCAQPCRLPYTACDRENQPLQQEGFYLLSPKDLCGLDAVPDLIAAGVDSFKIEGRMKRPEYVAVCVLAYRHVVDACLEGRVSKELISDWKNRMAQVFNRGGFTEGYYRQHNGKNMIYPKAPGHIGVEIGKIISLKDNQLTVKLKQRVHKGDILQIEGKREAISLTCNVTGQPGERIVLKGKQIKELSVGQPVKCMQSAKLMEKLQAYGAVKRLLVKGELVMQIGKPATLTCSLQQKTAQYRATVYGDVVEKAQKNPVTEDTVRAKLLQTGNTGFQFTSLSIYMEDGIFYSIKALKDLRRMGLMALENSIKSAFYRKENPFTIETEDSTTGQKSMSPVAERSADSCIAMVSDTEQLLAIQKDGRMKDIYLDLQFFQKETIMELCRQQNDVRYFIVLPPVLRKNNRKEVMEILSFVMENPKISLVVRNLDELALVKGMDFRGNITMDYSLYAMNDAAAAWLLQWFPQARLTYPVELNARQINTLSYANGDNELIVYGYQQLMVSTQCVRSTVAGCNQESESVILKDRYHKNFWVQPICKYCYNLLYNGMPTVLFDQRELMLREADRIRFHFTKENERQVLYILSCYFEGREYTKEKTRGHIKRGVE